jgi:hypothetical protein
MPVSTPLARLYALAVAEEVASELRHEAVNGFGGLAAMAYQLWRRVTGAHPPLAQDAAIVGVYKGFSTHVTSAAERLEVRFLPDALALSEPVDAAATVRGLARDVAPDAELAIAEGTRPARVHPIELQAIVFGLLDAAGSHPRVRLEANASDLSITVGPLPGPGPDRPSLGVRVAQRLAARWRGEVDLVDSGDGWAARLRLPVEDSVR